MALSHPGAAHQGQEPFLGAAAERPIEATLARVAERLEKRHRVDIRLTIPFFGSSYYLTLLADRERREVERRERERAEYPLLTLGNVTFMTMSASVISTAAMVGILIFSAIVRF